MSSSLESLLSRFSTDNLCEPAPSGEILNDILSAAMRAPDHGKLRPWRLAIVQGAARKELAERVVASLKRIDPDVPEAKIERARARFSDMPMTLILGQRLHPDNKIPLAEQSAAVSAAVMNVLNALHFTGFGGIWVSGTATYDSVLATELGFPAPDALSGFIFIGTPGENSVSPKRGDIRNYITEWTGSPARFAADEERKAQ